MMAKRMSWDKFITEAKAIHGNKYEYIKDENIATHGWVKIKCKKHGWFMQKVYSHLQGHGCDKCAREKSARKRSITLDEFLEKAKMKHGDRYDYSLIKSIKNNCTKVKIICNQCGTIFNQKVNNHLNGQGCSRCRISKLEAEAEKILKNKGISFKTQKTFNWLKNKREMPLDFYLPDYDIAIECQGEQHYKSNKNSFFTEEKVEIIKERDELKYNLCNEHNIQIYYVKYNESVEEKITEIINEQI